MSEKIAPVQGYSAGIPWSMHLRAYDAYCKKYGPQPEMIDFEGRNCRGGFSDGELDYFIPGWREELSEIKNLNREIERLRAGLHAIIIADQIAGAAPPHVTLRRLPEYNVETWDGPHAALARQVLEGSET
jgi:hypothetical protein